MPNGGSTPAAARRLALVRAELTQWHHANSAGVQRRLRTVHRGPPSGVNGQRESRSEQGTFPRRAPDFETATHGGGALTHRLQAQVTWKLARGVESTPVVCYDQPDLRTAQL